MEKRFKITAEADSDTISGRLGISQPRRKELQTEIFIIVEKTSGGVVEVMRELVKICKSDNEIAMVLFNLGEISEAANHFVESQKKTNKL